MWQYFSWRVCLAKTQPLLKCPYVLKSSDHLQMREDEFRSFDGNARSIEPQFSRGRWGHRGKNDDMWHGYDREGQVHPCNEGESVSVCENVEQKTNLPLLKTVRSQKNTQRTRAVFTHRFKQRPTYADKSDSNTIIIEDLVGFRCVFVI